MFDAESFSDSIFKFSKTEPYNAQIEQARFETRICILNAGDIFYILIIYVSCIPISFLLTLSRCKYTSSFWLKHLTAVVRKAFSRKTLVAKGLELLYTTQMILVLSAYINVKSPPSNPGTTDQISFVFAMVILFTYGCFILLVVPYILLSYWKIP